MVRRVFSGWMIAAALLVAGCAATRREEPPDVARQPQPISAGEAVLEGEASARQATAQAAAAAATATPTRAGRSRPSGLSTQEIRDQHSTAPMPLDFPQRLDDAHDRVYTGGQRFVQATDRHFAAQDEPLKPVPAAPFRLGATLETIDRANGPEFNFDVAFDIALSLPNIEKRLRVFVTSGALDSGPRDNRNPALLRAGLRYALLNHVDFSVGVRVDLPPVAFATVKWSREYQPGAWDFYPLVELFAETKQSVGYATGATFDRWTGRTLLRASTFAKWRHDLNQTAWSQTLIYARARELIVPDRYGSYLSADDIGRGWGLRLLASGEDTNQVARYQTSLFYRGRTSHHWLYWFVEPLVRWDRAWNWNADPGITVGFDALFWNLARPAR